MGAKRPSASALGGKSNVKPNGRRRCDGADYETVSPIISKKVYGNSWEILFYDLPMLSVGYSVIGYFRHAINHWCSMGAGMGQVS